MSLSEQIFASFFSKAGERITDHTHKLKLNLECLEKSLKELNAKASEVGEQRKGLGQNKRKRGIEEWLTRVKSIEHEVVELGAEAESEGFIRNLMDGGKVAKLNEDVIKLIEQSQRLDGCGTKGVKLLTSTMVGKAFEENCNKILSLLATGEVPSIGIYGMILKEVEKFEGRLSSMHAFNRFLKTRFHDAVHYHGQVGKGCDGGGNDIFGGDDRVVYLSECNLEDGKILGSGIQRLKIRECEGLSNCIVHDFSPFSYPSSLKMLIIERCGGIQCVLTNSRESLALFSSLQLIHLEALKDFERLIQKREIGAAPARAVFSSLTMLRIINCNRTRKLGLPVSGVPNLTHLDITNCGGIEEIFEDEGRGSITLPNLKTLSLFGLPRLKFVCKATIICNMLMFISIFRCPELMKKLPVQSVPVVPPPPFRRVIRVEREWWESLEWENPSLPLLLQPFVQFLI